MAQGSAGGFASVIVSMSFDLTFVHFTGPNSIGMCSGGRCWWSNKTCSSSNRQTWV